MPSERTEFSLLISERVLEGILRAARQAGGNECMGLLGARPATWPRVVSAAWLLPAEASPGHAQVEPVALARAVEKFRRHGKVIVGIWHSHGHHGVFHSATDDQTVRRLFPALAEHVYRQPAPAVLAPAVTDRDAAVLPLETGEMLKVTLMGAPVAGMAGANERAQWSSVQASYSSSVWRARVIRDKGTVRLEGAGVRLRLGVPDGASVTIATEEPAGMRWATLWSLVVNQRGEQYAEAVTIHSHSAAVYVNQEPCAVVPVENGDAAGPGPAKIRAGHPLGVEDESVDGWLPDTNLTNTTALRLSQ